MDHARRPPLLLQRRLQPLGHRHRPVPPPRAADGHREVAPVLSAVTRQQVRQEVTGSAREAAQQVKATAQDAAQVTKDEAKVSAQDAADRTRQAARDSTG